MGAAAFIGGGSAFAADLGGNCCADLEERIAELEATTARKGNRKVSLTITGWVQSQVFWFDDGTETNTYVVDQNNDLSSNVKFTGSAQIAPGWKAGYSLWLYTDNNGKGYSSLVASGGNPPAGVSPNISVENSYWFIQSDQLGKVSVGKQSLAADNAALGTDFSGTLFPANGVTFDGAFFPLVNSNGTLAGNVWANGGFFCSAVNVGIGQDCNGTRLNGVRYDSPTFAGFTLSASWGEDDYWDVAGRYTGEFSGFKVSLAAAYSEITDASVALNDTQTFQVGGMVKHLASGLWIHGTWNHQDVDNGTPVVVPVGSEAFLDSSGFYIKGGISQKYFSLGSTHIYGEYGQNDDMFNPTSTINGVAIASSEARRWGVGVVQEIDAAAMSLWVKYRHHELDITDVTGASPSLRDADMFLAGAVIFY